MRISAPQDGAARGKPGRRGDGRHGYPGAYAPVISVAASGWVGQWKAAAPLTVNQGWQGNTPDPTAAAD
jgi:hypothetical protein